MNMEEMTWEVSVSTQKFKPRPEFTVDWERPYDNGPSDPHLHAMGQFIANYSAVEWQIAELFALVLGKPIKEAQRLSVDANLSMSGIIRYTKQRLAEVAGEHTDSAKDLSATIKAFEDISSIRHKIVHWQWGLDEGEDASLTDFIKPKGDAKSVASLTLEDLRQYCSKLMKIFQALRLGREVIAGGSTRQQILEARNETSPEKLFLP
ncbi:hypothetical protein [Pseudomonas syringae]|uniref:hypothetical protein n=1 Tax=Pseudomonas syringae TaxID=317 RepID=UPI000BB6331E|nr:hypothetical protein [Pseudomonas syringae]PBP44186.1 hypothetical protein CCL13_16910 [Pseudomonas syringae]